MKVQIITDSTSDMPEGLANELGIRVVPIYVRFGDKTYRDGVDISKAGVFNHTSGHISSKISGTYNSAAMAKKTLGNRCPIEVIDARGLYGIP